MAQRRQAPVQPDHRTTLATFAERSCSVGPCANKVRDCAAQRSTHCACPTRISTLLELSSALSQVRGTPHSVNEGGAWGATKRLRASVTRQMRFAEQRERERDLLAVCGLQ